MPSFIKKLLENNRKKSEDNKKREMVIEYLKKGKFSKLSELDLNSVLTIDIIKEYYPTIKEYLETINSSEHNIFRTNTLLFDYVTHIDSDFHFFLLFDNSLITDAFINENADKIANSIKSEWEIPSVLSNKKVILDAIFNIYGEVYLIFFKFDTSLYTDELIMEYLEPIVDYYIRIGKEEISVFDIEEKVFLNKLVTEEIIKRGRIDIIADYWIKKGTIPKKYRDNVDFFNAYIRKKGISENIFDFNEIVFTDEFIKKHLKSIVNVTLKKGRLIIPNQLKKNKIILEELIRRQGLTIEMTNEFDNSLFDDEFVNKHAKDIIPYFERYDILPPYFKNSKLLLDAFIKNYKYKGRIFGIFDSSLFTEDFIITNKDLILTLTKKTGEISPVLREKQIIYQLLIEEIKRNLSLKDTIKQGKSKIIVYMVAYADDKTREEIGKLLDIDTKTLKEKMDYLMKNNEDVVDTINGALFQKRYSGIDVKKLELFVAYEDIQEKIVKLNDKQLEVFIKMVNYLDNSSYDICPIINNFLNNYENYTDLLNSIDVNSLSEEEFHNLLIILQEPSNYLKIKDCKSLGNKNYQKRRTDYFDRVEKKIQANTIALEDLKEAVFRKRYGISIDKADFLMNRYCKRIELLDNSGLPKKDILLLKNLYHIYHCNEIEELKFYYMGPCVNEDFYSLISLEASIRKDFAELYSEALYKPQEKDKVDSNQFFEESYEGKKPDIYVLQDDFNLQIHVLGAYSYFQRPENFKTDWERPQITNHGICTSFIGNNQIANARDIRQHPIYGFSSYEGGALLLSGNYDLISTYASKSYVVSYQKTENNAVFYDPKSMIDNTRHTHNEMVLERRNLAGTSSFKRMPNYIVYIVDDIQNKENFSKNNDYFKETVQAANDHNVPIIIVDRLYYAKREHEKCKNLYKEIFQEKGYEKVSDLIVTYMNNIVGCRLFENQTAKEYQKAFSISGFNKLYDKMIEEMNRMTEDQQKVYLLNLYKVILLEYDKINFTDQSNLNMYEYYKPLQFESKLSELEKRIKQLRIEMIESVPKETIHPNTKVTDYYYQSNNKVQSLIDLDVSKGLTQEEIMAKINNGEYEGRKR